MYKSGFTITLQHTKKQKTVQAGGQTRVKTLSLFVCVPPCLKRPVCVCVCYGCADQVATLCHLVLIGRWSSLLNPLALTGLPDSVLRWNANAGIRLHKFNPVSTQLCHGRRISSVRPEHKCQEGRTLLVVWPNQRTAAWNPGCLRHWDVKSSKSEFYVFPRLAWRLLQHVPPVAMIDRFMTLVPDRSTLEDCSRSELQSWKSPALEFPNLTWWPSGKTKLLSSLIQALEIFPLHHQSTRMNPHV